MWFLENTVRKLLGGKEVNTHTSTKPVRTRSVENVRVEKKVLLLYRFDINRNPKYTWWADGHAYVLAFDVKQARKIVERFARNKGYKRIDRCASICGKKTQNKIKVVTKDKKMVTLAELVKTASYRGVVAFSSCRESIHRDLAFEVESGYRWQY